MRCARETHARAAGRLTLLALLCTAPIVVCACKKGPDASTPRKAALRFAHAAETGDLNELRQVAAGSEPEFQLAVDLGRTMQGFSNFSSAVTSKFPQGSVSDMSLDLAAELEADDEKIDGDSATLTPKAGGDESEPLRLRRSGAGWTVDLSFLDRDDSARGNSQKLPAVAAIWNDAAQEIRDGKFDTLAQVKAAVRLRLRVAGLGEAAGKVELAHSDVASLQAAFEQYKVDAGDYPPTTSGIAALTQKPVDAVNWRGPYLRNALGADPWGHPYVYVAPGMHNTNGFDLHSLGPDGKEATADDIDNWSGDASR